MLSDEDDSVEEKKETKKEAKNNKKPQGIIVELNKFMNNTNKQVKRATG